MEVIGTDEFEAWFLALGDDDAKAVDRVVGLLAAKGLSLGHPYSSAIKGWAFAIRELRVQSGGRPIRVFYAYDPARDAVLIIGGDKTGNDRFYEAMKPVVERLWGQYLVEREAEARAAEEAKRKK